MAEIAWYYAHDQQQLGPVSSAELKRLAESGGLSPDDLVWREGMDDWAPGQRVKGLFPHREPADAGAAAAGADRASPSPPTPPPAEPAGPPVVGPTPPPAPTVAAAVATLPVAQPPGELPPVVNEPPGGADSHVRPGTPDPLPPGLRTVLFAAQGILWATCVMVVILGGALFMLTMVEAKNKSDQANSAQVSATLFIGAYALARAGERACLLLENYLTKRR